MKWIARIFGGSGDPNGDVAARAAELSLGFLRDQDRTISAESLTEVMALIMFGLVVDLKSEGVTFDGRLMTSAFIDALEKTNQREFQASQQDSDRLVAVFGARFRDYRGFLDQLSGSGADYDEATRRLARRFAEYLLHAENGSNVVGEPPLAAGDALQKLDSHVGISAFFTTRLAAFNRYAASRLR